MLQRLKPVAICWSSVAVGQQVAGQLFDGELVERHVAVEGVDHPVAIRPDLAVVVEVDAVGVGVAGGVEPVAAAVLAPVRRGQQLIDVASRRRRATVSLTNASTSAGSGGRPVRSRLSRRASVRRSASGAGFKPVCFQLGEDEASIGLRTQASFLHRRAASGRIGGDERPVRLILGARRRSTA